MIIRRCSRGCNVVVLGSSNIPSHLSRENFGLGRTCLGVLHGSQIPVIIVKHLRVSGNSKLISNEQKDSRRRVGICVHASEASRNAFRWALKELIRPDDIIYIIHVSTAKSSVPKETGSRGTAGEDFENSDKMLHRFTAACAAEQVPDYQLIHSHSSCLSVSTAIENLTRIIAPDIVVIGSSGGSLGISLARSIEADIVFVKP